MPKDKESLVSRAKKLVGENKSFEIQSQSDQVVIFCKSCQSKFKVDAIHLNTQYQSHLSSKKHKKSIDKNILQPSILGAVASASEKKSKDDSYSMTGQTMLSDVKYFGYGRFLRWFDTPNGSQPRPYDTYFMYEFVQ